MNARMLKMSFYTCICYYLLHVCSECADRLPFRSRIHDLKDRVNYFLSLYSFFFLNKLLLSFTPFFFFRSVLYGSFSFFFLFYCVRKWEACGDTMTINKSEEQFSTMILYLFFTAIIAV